MSLYMSILDILCKQNYKISFCTWRISCYIFFKIHPYSSIYQSFISFYGLRFHFKCPPHFLNNVLMDTWLVFIVWLLWIMLGTFVYRCLFESLFSVILDVTYGLKLLSHDGFMFTFLRTIKLFSTVAAPFYSPTSNSQEFHFLHILTYTCYFVVVLFCLVIILVGVKQYCGFDLYFTHH